MRFIILNLRMFLALFSYENKYYNYQKINKFSAFINDMPKSFSAHHSFIDTFLSSCWVGLITPVSGCTTYTVSSLTQ